MRWFLGQISRAAPPQTSHTYDYRVVLAYDQSTISVKMPLDAYDVDEANAELGVWALIEPIDDSEEPARVCVRVNSHAGRAVGREPPTFATVTNRDRA